MNTIHRCSLDRCKQGRKGCETPLACQVPLEEDGDFLFDMTDWKFVAALFACIALIGIGIAA